MAENVLVTGATGTIGSILVEKLAAASVRARALVRSPAKGQPIEKLGLTVALGDLAKPETLRPALEGIEKVFLLSAPDPRQAELQSARLLNRNGQGQALPLQFVETNRALLRRITKERVLVCARSLLCGKLIISGRRL